MKHVAGENDGGNQRECKAAEEKLKTGYKPADLDKWAKRAKAWARTGDAFVYFISGAKVRNPAAAQALIDKL